MMSSSLKFFMTYTSGEDSAKKTVRVFFFSSNTRVTSENREYAPQRQSTPEYARVHLALVVPHMFLSYKQNTQLKINQSQR